MNEIEKKESTLTPITTNGEIIEYFSREEINMVLQALQEKEERDKGCEYCKGDLEGCTKPLPKKFGSHDMFVADGKGELKLFETKYKNNTAYINYCPMCGRKLSDHIGEANGKEEEK